MSVVRFNRENDVKGAVRARIESDEEGRRKSDERGAVRARRVIRGVQ